MIAATATIYALFTLFLTMLTVFTYFSIAFLVLFITATVVGGIFRPIWLIMKFPTRRAYFP